MDWPGCRSVRVMKFRARRRLARTRPCAPLGRSSRRRRPGRPTVRCVWRNARTPTTPAPQSAHHSSVRTQSASPVRRSANRHSRPGTPATGRSVADRPRRRAAPQRLRRAGSPAGRVCQPACCPTSARVCPCAWQVHLLGESFETLLGRGTIERQNSQGPTPLDHKRSGDRCAASGG